jgi:hypothetical protein
MIITKEKYSMEKGAAFCFFKDYLTLHLGKVKFHYIYKVLQHVEILN